MEIPTIGDETYEDGGLDPNTRYSYRAVLEQSDGTQILDETSAVTLAIRPRLTLPVATHSTGLQQPIIDELNPDYTEYRITLHRREDGHTSVSDWSTSKCRTFGDLKPDSTYRISMIARNLDGVETADANQYAEAYGLGEVLLAPTVRTWGFVGSDDPWVKDRIRETALVYGLTGPAADWMNNDILIEWMRGEPGWAGAGSGYVGIGHSFLATLLHEAMHVFWTYWDGFPEPCDQMNLYTFRRDVAQFVIDFRNFGRSEDSNPLEPWRPYYNMMVGFLTQESLGGEDFWEVLEQGEYGKLWPSLSHRIETGIPSYNPHHPSLIPPRLREYFSGFILDGEYRTWEEEFDWYSKLADGDRALWHPFLTHEIIHYSSPEDYIPLDSSRTQIPEPLRTTLRKTDLRMLVDFLNTLEDQTPWEWRFESPGFWEFYVTRHLYRLALYADELNASVGINLEASNRNDVIQALRALHDLHCSPGVIDCGYDPTLASAENEERVTEEIQNLEYLSDLQRRVLLEMIDLSPD